MPQQWTPVLPLIDVGPEPQQLRVAGETLVVFRDAHDAPVVFLDRCPHRGAALSLGNRLEDGSLQCRYHGWCFDAEGRCLRVPFNDLNDRARAKIAATAIPCRELAGCLWIFTGTDAPAEPTLPDTLQGDPTRFGTYRQEWQAHWTRAVENFIDFTHPPYAHRDTIGMYSFDYAERGGTASVDVEEHPAGMIMTNYMGRRSYGFRADWYAPNMTRLHFGAGNELHVYSIPLSDAETRVMTVRQLPADADPRGWSDRAAAVDHQILDEDRLIVESQPGDIALAEDEISVATDAPTVQFRRWYRDNILSVAASA